MATVLFPLPDRDFDVTESAVPYRLLVDAGHDVRFATQNGATAACDPLLLTGVVFGQLGAEAEPKRLYADMTASDEFQAPVAWSALDDLRDFDAVFLVGGHAQGMKQLLDCEKLQTLLADFWQTKRPVGAICHGVLTLARTIDPATGQSVLHDRRTTCLPKYMERVAYWATAWRRGRYFRTYPAYVEDEVRTALADPKAQFERGPRTLFRRGTADDDRKTFVVEDGNYVSARWPGDAYRIARAFIERIEAQVAASEPIAGTATATN